METVHPEMTELPSPTRCRLYAAIVFICAVYFVYVGASKPPGLNASPWVMYVLALTWFAVSARLIEMSRGNPGRGTWVGFIFCAGMGVVFASIPFDGHPEACHTTSSIGLVGSNSLGVIDGINFCQGLFGAVGFLFIALAMAIAWQWIASRFGNKSSY